ncbi:MAG: tRNA (N6-isopentenyl adenosine(37)-C2)-methylthiotransferase MiaB [Polyangiaceae bacterium]
MDRPSYSLVTFGCQMNQHDSERMQEVLSRAGYVQVDDAAVADVVVLNTCSVREKAEQKLSSEVGRLGVLKRERPDLLIAVAGCVAQQDGERLLRRLPQIDLVLGPDNIVELPALLSELRLGGPPRVRTVFDVDAPSFLRAEPVAGNASVSAYVTVMKGCDERCTFCIVPHTRGPERYRPSTEILGEIRRLVEAGTREVVLLGQTVNSYRDPSRGLPPAVGPDIAWEHTHPSTARMDESEFAALLQAIAKGVPELERLRYVSPHPRHLTASLIHAHANLNLLARHVHLPVQSGSNAVLKRMLRRYSVEEFRERVNALRDRVPGITLSTDVIVGFPGETPDDFQATLELVGEIGFVGLFGFKYSPRPFTPAQRLTDDVPESEKSERLARLFELSDRLRRRHLEGLVGTEQRVLVEGRGKNGNYSGRTEQNEIVHFGARGELAGGCETIAIVRAFKNSLEGKLPDPQRQAPLASAATQPNKTTLPVVS